jgi:hypothetical protein
VGAQKTAAGTPPPDLTPPDLTPEQRLAGFLAAYTPEVAALAEACLGRMRRYLPGAVELVYDNYNALAIGFGPSERASQAVLSLAVYPHWVSLFFLHGKGLPDPDGILRGKGNVVRHVVLKRVEDLDLPPVRVLIAQALQADGFLPDTHAPNRLVIKSVSAKQRPRRPV